MFSISGSFYFLFLFLNHFPSFFFLPARCSFLIAKDFVFSWKRCGRSATTAAAVNLPHQDLGDVGGRGWGGFTNNYREKKRRLRLVGRNYSRHQ